MTYVLFDLLHLDGRDMRPLPLVERKTILEKVLAKLPVRSPVQFSADVTGRGAMFFALACKRGLEGIISKRANAPYRSGRSSDWLKTKCTSRQEFVIGGYRRESTGRPNPRPVPLLRKRHTDRFHIGAGAGAWRRQSAPTGEIHDRDALRFPQQIVQPVIPWKRDSTPAQVHGFSIERRVAKLRSKAQAHRYSSSF
jgi:ATP-dependent DNA ligase